MRVQIYYTYLTLRANCFLGSLMRCFVLFLSCCRTTARERIENWRCQIHGNEYVQVRGKVTFLRLVFFTGHCFTNTESILNMHKG